ncbi:ATP-binding protein [Nonomuraea rhizosphaerae]|uniref:ATP-binding protein n=1 Tax=Nonomuraea rhizosphaerae TaxID=2665663 RepID=UPI001C600B24|nr:AfsR/SARP family transcriptional regulator [Nonomuraea rhizosphaerae]
MEFRVLGQLEVAERGLLLPLGPRRQQAVLAVLLSHAARVVSLDRIVEEVWEDAPPATATATVQAYISNLRSILEPGRKAREPSRILLTRAPGYLLAVTRRQVDALVFEDAVERSRKLLGAGRPEESLSGVEEALTLWRAEPYETLTDYAFAAVEVARLRELLLVGREVRAGSLLALGRHDEALGDLDTLSVAHPLRESLVALRMLALYRAGRQADALDAFHRVRLALADQFGVDPGPALRQRFGEILEQSATLDWRPVPVTAQPAGTVEPQPPASPDDLVGRDAELLAVESDLAAVLGGNGRVVVLSGEPGIGKSRLAEAFAARTASRGALVVWSRAVEDTAAPPYWLGVQLLRRLAAARPEGFTAAVAPHRALLAPLMPELTGQVATGPREGNPDAMRVPIYDAIARVVAEIAALTPLTLVFEDMHWADVPSTQLVGYLAAETRHARILVVASLREREETPAVRDLLGSLARLPSLRRLRLGPLEPDDVAALLKAHTESAASADLVAAVCRRTAGNPFFVTELARMLRSERALTDQAIEGRLAEEIPDGVRDVIRRRWSRLPDATRGLLSVAAVVGQEFGLTPLDAVTGLEEERLLDDLDAAVVTGMIVEAPEAIGRYRFAHPLVRETLYDELNRVRRARLHERLGLAMEDPDEVAHHLWHAWPLIEAETALPHLLRAAERAQLTFAHEQAETLLNRALRLAATMTGEQRRIDQELRIRVRIAGLLAARHGYGAQVTEDALVEARTMVGKSALPAVELTGVLWGLCAACITAGNFDRADEVTVEMARLADRTGDPLAQVATLEITGMIAYYRGDLARAWEALQAALPLAGAVDDATAGMLAPRLVIPALSAIVALSLGDEAGFARHVRVNDELGPRFGGLMISAFVRLIAARHAWLRDDPRLAREYAVGAVQFGREHSLAQIEWTGAAIEGWAEATLGNPEGITLLREALRRREESTMVLSQNYYLTLLAELELARGETAAALDALDRADELTAATGERYSESFSLRVRALAERAAGASPEHVRALLRRAADVARGQGNVVLLRQAEDCLAEIP